MDLPNFSQLVAPEPEPEQVEVIQYFFDDDDDSTTCDTTTTDAFGGSRSDHRADNSVN